MTGFFKNRMLMVSIGLLAIYWSFAPLVPKPYVSSAMSLLSLFAGTLMASRYSEATYRIMFRGERSSAGSHYAILGAFLVSLGVIYSGMYSLLWIYFQQPQEWTATAVSSFGRGLVAIGFWLMTISPDTVRSGKGYPMGFWKSVLVAFGLVLAFLAGTHFSNFG